MTDTKKSFPWRAAVQLVLIVFVSQFLPMIISGRWDWPEAWLYAVTAILAFVLSRLLASRRHPDLITERARFMEARNTKPWDKFLAPALGFGSILILVVVGLDERYGWSPAFPREAKVIAFIGILFGYAFSSWALIENRFFSGTVRIQTERGHHVVSSGPYRIVRHPGYAGAAISYLLIPVLLDSSWALISSILLLVVMVVRTALEDKTLQEELPGYREFTRKTRYRLLPGIW